MKCALGPVSALHAAQGEMSDHSRLVRGDHLDDPEVRAGYEEARRAIELGAVVRQLRLDAGLFQEELAQRAGMAQPALSRLERGGTVPTLTVLDGSRTPCRQP